MTWPTKIAWWACAGVMSQACFPPLCAMVAAVVPQNAIVPAYRSKSWGTSRWYVVLRLTQAVSANPAVGGLVRVLEGIRVINTIFKCPCSFDPGSDIRSKEEEDRDKRNADSDSNVCVIRQRRWIFKIWGYSRWRLQSRCWGRHTAYRWSADRGYDYNMFDRCRLLVDNYRYASSRTLAGHRIS